MLAGLVNVGSGKKNAVGRSVGSLKQVRRYMVRCHMKSLTLTVTAIIAEEKTRAQMGRHTKHLQF